MLIIEGADKFVELQNFEIIPIDFWLPTIFPDRIRCIVTINDDSEAAEYFENQSVEFIELTPPPAAIDQQIDDILAKETSMVHNPLPNTLIYKKPNIKEDLKKIL